MRRHVLIAVLLWLACVAELGWSVWTGLRIAPAFLDLVVVVACLICRPRMVVFWGGLAGLLVSLIHSSPLQFHVPMFASIALIAAWSQPSELKRTTVTATAIRSLLVLAGLSVGRILITEFPEITMLSALELQVIAQLALTFSISLFICMLFIWRQRRTVWE